MIYLEIGFFFGQPKHLLLGMVAKKFKSQQQITTQKSFKDHK